MSINVGAHGAQPDVGGIATVILVTQATGSTFFIFAAAFTSFGATPVQDNKGNTYSQIGTEVVFAGAIPCRAYKCVNAAGGSNHQFSSSSTGGFASIWVVEILAGDTTTPLDASDLAVDASATPWDSPAVTPAGGLNELMIGVGIDDSSGAGDSFTSNLSFTNLDAIADGSAFITGISAYKIVNGTSGSYQYEGTSTQASQMLMGIYTFKEAGGGGADSLLGQALL